MFYIDAGYYLYVLLHSVLHDIPFILYYNFMS
jgi:hypothetical protein